jgi:hypothetical protein
MTQLEDIGVQYQQQEEQQHNTIEAQKGKKKKSWNKVSNYNPKKRQ